MTTAVIEALATGLPAITTDHSGFADQIIEGKNGYLAPEGNYKVLAQKIIMYLRQPESWGALGVYGRKRMLAMYDSKRLIDQQVSIYRSVLGNATRF